MKLNFKVSNMIYSDLLIQPTLAFCHRIESFSTGKSNDQIPRMLDLLLIFLPQIAGHKAQRRTRTQLLPIEKLSKYFLGPSFV
jgi:hypothetical protein